jgi:RNA polymerase sigma factor (sigma-70 family)
MALSNALDSENSSLSLSEMKTSNFAEVRAKPPYRPISATLAIASTVSVIIPARNEAANLPHVFSTLPPWVDEIVLVDGNSVDDTVAVTRTLCPRAKVVHQPGTGKGDALRAGFAAATGDILATIDADGSTDGAELIRFVSALVAGADFAKGSRFSSSGGSDDITGVRRYGNRLLSFLVNWMFGTHFTDLCYGYNAFWASHLDAVEISSGPGFEVETLMIIRAAKAGLRIYEVPSHECPRIFGESNLHAVRDGWRILRVIAREWLHGPRKRGPRYLATAPPSAQGVVDGPDREIVAAIAAGEATGMAAAFDRYAHGLYTYCRSRLSEPADAADAVVATFVIASAQARRLAQPDRLRAWLFAVARNECHMRLRAAVPSARLYEAANAMDDTGAFAVFTEQADVCAMVRAALAGMDPVDREISELNLRHGFYGADLADLLGMPPSRVHAIASRVRSRFGRSLGVLLVARSEREHCPQLAAILDGRGGLRWRVRRHVGRCEVCAERKRSGLNPAIGVNLLPVIPAPSDLRQQTLDLVGSVAAVAAATAAVALLGGVMYYAHDPSGQTGPVAAAAKHPPPSASARPSRASRTPVRSPSSAVRASSLAPGFVLSRPESARSCPTPTPSRSPSPTCSRSPSRSPSPSRSRSRSPSRSPSPSPSPSRSPAPTPSPSPTSSPKPSISSSLPPRSSRPTTPATSPSLVLRIWRVTG